MIKNQEQKLMVYWPLKLTMLTLAFAAVMYGIFYLNHHGVSKNMQNALALQTSRTNPKSSGAVNNRESLKSEVAPIKNDLRKAKVILEKPASPKE